MGWAENLQRFAFDPSLVAMRILPQDLPGILRKVLEVPHGCCALVADPEGGWEWGGPGSRMTVRREAILAKGLPIELKMIFPDQRSADGYSVSTTCAVSVHVPAYRVEFFRDFVRNFLSSSTACTTSDLKTFLSGELRRLVAEYVGARRVEDLHRKSLAISSMSFFDVALERFVFGSGLGCDGVTDMTFASFEYEQQRVEEGRRREEDRRAREAAAAREERIRRLEALLQQEDAQSLLNRIRDERVRSLVYAKLLEGGSALVSKEDLVRRLQGAGEEVVELLFQAVHGLSGAMEDSPDPLPVLVAEDIYIVTGNRLVRIVAVDPDLEPEVREFGEGLRSVRRFSDGGEELLVLGGKVRALVLRGGRMHAEPQEFPLEASFRPRGGINSLALDGRWLYATHSEFGVARWSLEEPGRPAERVFDDVTARHRTTRGICTTEEWLLFASGPEVYRVRRGDPRARPERMRWPEVAPLTVLAAQNGWVFGGAADGSLVGWLSMDSPEGVILARRREPILSVRLVALRRAPHVVYTSHDPAVHARVIGLGLQTEYETGGVPVSFMDAASDQIAAVDATGGRLFLWRSSQPEAPAAQLDCWRFAQRPVVDVCMWKRPDVPGAPQRRARGGV